MSFKKPMSHATINLELNLHHLPKIRSLNSSPLNSFRNDVSIHQVPPNRKQPNSLHLKHFPHRKLSLISPKDKLQSVLGPSSPCKNAANMSLNDDSQNNVPTKFFYKENSMRKEEPKDVQSETKSPIKRSHRAEILSLDQKLANLQTQQIKKAHPYSLNELFSQVAFDKIEPDPTFKYKIAISESLLKEFSNKSKVPITHGEHQPVRVFDILDQSQFIVKKQSTGRRNSNSPSILRNRDSVRASYTLRNKKPKRVQSMILENLPFYKENFNESMGLDDKKVNARKNSVISERAGANKFRNRNHRSLPPITTPNNIFKSKSETMLPERLLLSKLKSKQDSASKLTEKHDTTESKQELKPLPLAFAAADDASSERQYFAPRIAMPNLEGGFQRQDIFDEIPKQEKMKLIQKIVRHSPEKIYMPLGTGASPHYDRELSTIMQYDSPTNIERERINHIKKSLLYVLKSLNRMGINLEQLLKYQVFSTKPYEKPGSFELIEAAKKGDIRTVEFKLILNKYLIYDFDNFHMTALHWAIARGFDDIAKFLISKNADIDAKDIIGRTPLYFAIKKNQIEILQLLLYSGCNPWSTPELSYERILAGKNIAANYLETARKINIAIRLLPLNQRKDGWLQGRKVLLRKPSVYLRDEFKHEELSDDGFE